MSSTKHSSYQTSVDVLATELNALTAGSDSAISGAGTGVILDNSVGLNLYCDFEFISGGAWGVARSGSLKVSLYFSVAADGVNYTDAGSAFDRAQESWYFDATVTTRRLIVRNIEIPPGKVKCYVNNGCGVAMPAVNNIVRAWPHFVTVL